MAVMKNNEKEIVEGKLPPDKKPSIFMKFMGWIEKGQKNSIQCGS
jgi:hypothetical protein